MANTKLAAEDGQEDGHVEQAEHPAEHATRHVALQRGDGEHVDDDHPDAGDDLEHEPERRRVHEGRQRERHGLDGDAATMTGASRRDALRRLATPAEITPPRAVPASR